MPRLPWNHALFVPVLLRVLLLIAAGFVAVLVTRPRRLRVWRRSTLFMRARVWLVIGPLFVIAVFTGGFVAFLLAAYVMVFGAGEIVRVAGIERRYAQLLMLWGVVGLLVAALATDFFVFLPFGFFILLTLVPVLSSDGEDAHRQVADTLFAYLYVGLPIAYIIYVHTTRPWGLNFVVVVTIAVAVSDVAAYVVGSALKGPKLLPRQQLGKTWSGALGNLIGAGVAVALLWVAVPKQWSVAEVVVLTLAVGLGSIWGDLTTSFVARSFRATAKSTLLIGYGGVLDRVDSLLMAFPLSFYALVLTEKLVQ